MDSIKALLLVLLFSLAARAQEPIAEAPPPAWPLRPMMSLPVSAQKWTINLDGSCVQCSNCQVGMHHGDFNQMTLLWDTEYGRAQHGGSGPDRVAQYCRQRGIEIYNVTGRSFEDTRPWIHWAAKTGRFAAIGCFGSHFQTLYGIDFATSPPTYYVQNNWGGTFGNPYVYTEAQFKRHHEDSGAWVVIPKRPPPSLDPLYFQWWSE